MLIFPFSAFGHAILMQSAPSPNQVVDGKNVAIELHFNSRIDGKRSRLSLVDPAGKQHALEIEQRASDSLVSHAADLPPGAYILQWQILAEDGHITRGEVRFRAN
jgi:methionine-rich copper-binding protein CopC